MKTSTKLILSALAASVILTGCGKTEPEPAADPAAAQPEAVIETTIETTVETEPAVLDLTGDWKQTNGSETGYQTAIIQDGVIEVYWVNEEQDTKSLYWAGTYVAPDSAKDSYSWESENDTEKTSASLLASGNPTKEFSYKKGVLSFEASALGTTKTIKMERMN